MKDKSEIIRLHYHEGLSEREIHRRLGFSRKTIKKFIKEYNGALANQQKNPSQMEDLMLIPVKYDTSHRDTRVLTDEIMKLLDECIEQNEVKKRTGLKKQCMLKQDMYTLLESKGYKISYATVCRYVRAKLKSYEECYIRQGYVAGEKCEFDWGRVKLCIAGKWQHLYMSAFTFCKSNGRWADLFHREDSLAFLESHANFHERCQGVPHEIIYDNMRVAIASFAGNEKTPTQGLLRMSAFYGFKYRFCNARRGNEKGHVERSVEVIRRKAFCIKDHFDTIEAAIEHLHKTCNGLNEQKHIKASFEEDLRYLLPYKGMMGCFERREFKVDKYGTITFNNTHYSVPDSFVGKMVDVKIFSEKIQVYDQTLMIASHERSYTPTWRLNLDHYLPTLEKKPGALKDAVAFSQAPQPIRDIYESFFQKDGCSFIKLLLYVKQNSLSYDIIRIMCDKAIKSGVKEVTSDHIINLIVDDLNKMVSLETRLKHDQIRDFADKQLEQISELMSN